MRSSFGSNEQRIEAIKQWRTVNGVALEAQREARRTKEATRLTALQAETMSLRQQQVQEALKNGRIGPLEAELRQLDFAQDLLPAARQEAVRTWWSSHGTELKAEQDARRQRLIRKPDIPASPEP
jgi:hypothetical protein